MSSSFSSSSVRPTASTGVPILFCDDYVKPSRDYNDKEREAMKKLKSNLGDLDSEALTFVTDSTLHRYLRARKWDQDKATEMLKETLKWRKTYKPYEIDPDDVAIEAETGKAYVNGFDRHGRPLLVLTSARENTKTYDRQVKHIVFLFEKVVKLLPPDVEQVVVIIDFHKFNLLTSPPLHVAQSFLNILGNHYPERLGMAILQDAPLIWWPVFNVIKPFIDPVTAAKIKFLDKKQRDKLAELVDPKMMEKRLGGEFDFEWNFATYWKHLLAYPSTPA